MLASAPVQMLQFMKMHGLQPNPPARVTQKLAVLKQEVAAHSAANTAPPTPDPTLQFDASDDDDDHATGIPKFGALHSAAQSDVDDGVVEAKAV